MFTNYFLGYVSTKPLRVALVVAMGATLAALAAVALVVASGTAVGQQQGQEAPPLARAGVLRRAVGSTPTRAERGNGLRACRAGRWSKRRCGQHHPGPRAGRRSLWRACG